MRAECIKLPTSQTEWEIISDGFRQIRGFPFCAGAIDGTLVAVQRPNDFEGWYNRKGYPSFNIQAVCDHQKRSISFDIRPGSWNDAKTFMYSYFGRNLEQVIPLGFHVLADSGYGIAPMVMTPYEL
ncbi:hypothetical protein PR001_g17006 [Phytophthora rubi]|uniref:DDE Tnp4 domain-containing protein n=1 Tax=Phytophthora rubi TaxID=129364 RepID=A0A6A3KIS3_9STRA|nr:hypothetical protein PR001_g17006 [Phytophthora rubi]